MAPAVFTLENMVPTTEASGGIVHLRLPVLGVAGAPPGDHEGLQVVEHWNSANTVIFYRKDSELTGADREHQAVSMLALHLLQSALVHFNTLLLEKVLAEPRWRETLTDIDWRALTPLFWSNVNPYGRFRLDMERHRDLELASAGLPGAPPLPAPTDQPR